MPAQQVIVPYISPQQLVMSYILSIILLFIIIRLVQKGKLDIAYCWVWLCIGIGSVVIVLNYDWLTKLSHLLGAVQNTTTVFLLGFFVVLLMCLQFSLVVSSHRRTLKKLTQQMAILQSRLDVHDTAGDRNREQGK